MAEAIVSVAWVGFLGFASWTLLAVAVDRWRALRWWQIHRLAVRERKRQDRVLAQKARETVRETFSEMR